MNTTPSIDERVAEQARQAAQAMGKSLSHAVRDNLEQLAGRAQLESEIAAFLESTVRMPGRLAGWAFNRDELQRGAWLHRHRRAGACGLGRRLPTSRPARRR
jgi:hypothetical protein